MSRMKSQTEPLLCGAANLEPLDDSRNKLRKLFERWDNRLSLQGKSVLEQYIGGRLSLVVDVEFRTPSHTDRGPSDRLEATIVFDTHSAINHTEVARFVFDVDSRQNRNMQHWDQQDVFVEDVEVVYSANGLIPSLVRLYGVEYLPAERFGEARLYYSTVKSCYELLPAFASPEWEFGVGHVAASIANDAANHQVERTPEIVNGVANDKGRVIGNGLHNPEVQNIVSGIRIFLDEKFVEVRLGEALKDGVQLKNVLLGPFDL